MKDRGFDNVLNSFQAATRNNSKKTGHKEPYQILYESFYDIIKRRKLTFAEWGFAIYLRGKSCRYTNPFKLADNTIYDELGTTRRIIDPLKRKLQLKGIIKYNSGKGAGNWTEYTMIDSTMIHKRDKKLSTGYPQHVQDGTL